MCESDLKHGHRHDDAGAMASAPDRRIPEIEGLRAAAVTLVAAYHFDLGVPGGFIGVDLFFAISGFVIARQLLALLRTEDSAGELLSRFYRRRVLRLMPAALLLCCVIVTGSALRPAIFGSYSRNLANAIAGLSGVGNFYAAKFPDLHANEIRPLIHMWSLSIEEQFYLLFPIVLVVFRRRLRLAVASFGILTVMVSIAEATQHRSASAAFFSTPGRMAPIGLGLLIAAAFDSGVIVPSSSSSRWAEGIAVGCFAALAIGSRKLYWDNPYLARGGFVLLAVLMAALVAVCAGRPNLRVTKFLRWPVAQWLGSRSYSFYLWHFPIAFLFSSLPIAERGGLRLFMSLVLAELSYRFVERPLRNSTKIRFVQLVPILMLATSLILFLRSWQPR